MSGVDRNFSGSVPEVYDRLLVPLIFAGYADDLAQRLAVQQTHEVLEIAAGTGVLTRAIALRMPPGARLVATDLNQPMLDVAMAQQGGDPRITWRHADAMALPFSDAMFDAVACQFGAMFFPDKVHAYREARRVLRPGGRFMFSVWDRIADNEFADVVTKTLADVFPADPPAFMARTPHGYHDKDRIAEHVAAAGFGSISIETAEHISKAASAVDVAIAYCQGTPLRNEIVARDAARLQEATERCAQALAGRFGNGAIEGRIRAHVISASG